MPPQNSLTINSASMIVGQMDLLDLLIIEPSYLQTLPDIVSTIMICSVKTPRIKFSDQIRQMIEQSGLTRYAIWKETGIDQSTLSKFMLGQRGLPMKTLDRLADFLDLNITLGLGFPPKVDRSAGKGSERRLASVNDPTVEQQPRRGKRQRKAK